MTTSALPWICLYVAVILAACSGDTADKPPGVRVLVATPLADADYETLSKKASATKCLLGAAEYVQSGQPIVVRHKLDAGLDAAQQGLTADLVLTTVCEQSSSHDDLAYGTDDELIKQLLAPPGSECGLIVTLRVADDETRCEIAADPMLCDASAMPCVMEAASTSTTGDGSESAETTDPSTSESDG